MINLLKKLKFLNNRNYYPWFILIIIFSLLVYPPSVSVGKNQKIFTSIVTTPQIISINNIDSLKKQKQRIYSLKNERRIIYNLLNKNYNILEKQQYTIKQLK